MSGPLFPLGHVVMTPGAAAAFQASGDDPLAFSSNTSVSTQVIWTRTTSARTNSVWSKDYRILSAYRLTDGTRIWIITEADRSSTCILLPSEY